MTLSPGNKLLDFASMPGGASFPDMHKQGARGVSRYTAGTANAAESWKTIKAGEIAMAVHAGLDFMANFELSENTPAASLTPKIAGGRHGKADRQFLISRGYAPHAGVTVSWEPGNDSSLFGRVARFLEGYKAAVGRPIGLYAGLPALLHFRSLGLIDFTWLPMSASASGLSAPSRQIDYAKFMEKVATDHGINLCQNRNRWYNNGADEDIWITAPKIAWTHLQALDAATKPAVSTDGPYHGTNHLASEDGHWRASLADNGKINIAHDGKHARSI